VPTKDGRPPATVRNMISFLEGPELIIVLVVVLVLFGGAQLPKFAKNLGAAQRELKKAMEEGKSDEGSSDSK
jgi:sec-independent protein translocase protein TatA